MAQILTSLSDIFFIILLSPYSELAPSNYCSTARKNRADGGATIVAQTFSIVQVTDILHCAGLPTGEVFINPVAWPPGAKSLLSLPGLLPHPPAASTDGLQPTSRLVSCALDPFIRPGAPFVAFRATRVRSLEFPCFSSAGGPTAEPPSHKEQQQLG